MTKVAYVGATFVPIAVPRIWMWFLVSNVNALHSRTMANALIMNSFEMFLNNWLG